MAIAQDAIDEAIEAASAPEVPMAQFGLQLSSGRPAGLMLPSDVTDEELWSLLDGIHKIGAHLRAVRKPAAPTLLRAPALPNLRQSG